MAKTTLAAAMTKQTINRTIDVSQRSSGAKPLNSRPSSQDTLVNGIWNLRKPRSMDGSWITNDSELLAGFCYP